MLRGPAPLPCIADDTLEEEEEEEEEEVEEEEPEEEDEEDDEEDDDVDVSLEETPVKPGKRLVPQKQSSVTKVREGTLLRLLGNLGQAS